jgi:hypothetical protein
MTVPFESELDEDWHETFYMCSDEEDVATGGFVGVGEAALIDWDPNGYDRRQAAYLISGILYGMTWARESSMEWVDCGRLVFQVIAGFGESVGDSDFGRKMQQTSNRDKEGEISGGKSDANIAILNDFIFRAWFQSLAAKLCATVILILWPAEPWLQSKSAVPYSRRLCSSHNPPRRCGYYTACQVFLGKRTLTNLKGIPYSDQIVYPIASISKTLIGV